MSYFEDLLKDAIRKTEEELRENKLRLRRAPSGRLLGKIRPQKTNYYQVTGEKCINIDDDEQLIRELADKRFIREEIICVEKNLKQLKKLNEVYEAINKRELIDKLPIWYQSVLDVAPKAHISQNQRLYSPKTHVHETQCGIFVRSKSEVIIANALYNYGISFEYEKEYNVEDSMGFVKYSIYPDFTITLENGKIILWEHFGMLSQMEYCDRTAKKLIELQQGGFHIGENLIITMDNSKGSCNSLVIDEMTKNYILKK